MSPRSKNEYNGVKVFSATMAKTRARLSDQISEWIDENEGCEVVNTVVTQSSDRSYHCLTITVFYWEPVATA